MASARIVYASLTGNNEDIASIIEEAFEDLNVDVTTTEVSQALASDFEDVDICVTATYTYSDVGDGELPDEAVDFYEELQELDLTGKVYGCCGSGDRFYDDFATSVDDFDKAFAKTAPPKEQRMLRLIFLLKKMTSSILKLLQNSWLISSTPCNSK